MVYKPKPFQRPGIEIGSRVTRRWVQTTAGQLAPEDIVTDHGMIRDYQLQRGVVTIIFVSGEVLVCGASEEFRAFTEGESVGISR